MVSISTAKFTIQYYTDKTATYVNIIAINRSY